jgi:putative SOS response-associated peptidase YedK
VAYSRQVANLPLFPGIFPDQMAPIVRNGADGERELVMARWGMPGPPQFGGAPITNICNLDSPRLRGWLGKQNRCILALSFDHDRMAVEVVQNDPVFELEL